jgi:hypothetical protein
MLADTGSQPFHFRDQLVSGKSFEVFVHLNAPMKQAQRRLPSSTQRSSASHKPGYFSTKPMARTCRSAA